MLPTSTTAGIDWPCVCDQRESDVLKQMIRRSTTRSNMKWVYLMRLLTTVWTSVHLSTCLCVCLCVYIPISWTWYHVDSVLINNIFTQLTYNYLFSRTVSHLIVRFNLLLLNY